jgi:hypothetical protein
MNLIAKKNELEQLYVKYWKIQHQLEQEDTSVSDKDVEGKIRDVIADRTFLASLKATSFDDRERKVIRSCRTGQRNWRAA